MTIQLSDHFNYKKLIRFTIPTIVMMIFTSIYGIVDGIFVKSFAGTTPFSAINFIFPVLNILGTIGYMFGAGGSALISKTLGEGDREKASRLFSLFTYMSAALGVVLGVVGMFLIRPVASLLGAEGELLDDCVIYAQILLISMPAWILQYEFQTFFVTAEKPKLGFLVTVCAGVANMALDALFIAGFKWGLVGAAVATTISQILGGVIPIFYFARKNTSLLRLGKTNFDGKAILKALTNGLSEFVSGVSGSFVGILYNAQLLKYAGQNGLAAYGVLMYVNMIFYSIIFGFSNGAAPVVGYHYGAQNHDELKNLRKKCINILLIISVLMVALAEALGWPLSWMFARNDPELMAMTIRGFRLFSISFLLTGIGAFGSSFFTALNNGAVSAIISTMRTLLFETSCVFLFAFLWQYDGILLATTASEFLSAVVTIGFLLGFRKKYGY